ncbi:MAG: T9SS type A sorting domain-containing protein [Ignavibacteria bacterium]|nr:T9SS type A sorting domain-containing protein [Ignavibacteria bacterium]
MKVNIIHISLIIFLFATNVFSQWEKVKNIPPPYDRSYWLEMYFLPDKPNYGWVCGYDGRVLRTTDYGRTWQGTMIRGAYQLEHINFANERIGYTSGIGSDGFGKIYKTTDGGATWFDITPRQAEDLWGNWFVDPNYGIVVGGGCITPQRFFVTTNGGNSWAYVTQIDFFPNSGLTDVILYSRDGLGYATSSGWIWKTTNGGRNWQVFSKSGNNDWQEDLWISGNTIVVPYSVGCGGGGNSGGVRSSRDLGKSWNDFPTNISMFGAFLHDSLRGWVCGWDRAVYFTSDGGRTWSLKNCGIDPGVSLDDFWFINDTLGWVVGNGIYKFTGFKKVISKIAYYPDTIACEGDTITLRAVNANAFYQWSTNAVVKEIKVTKSGTYELVSWDSECDSIVPARVNVYFYPKPKINLSTPSPVYLCEGDTLKIWYKSTGKFSRWNTGEKDTILITKPGKYVVISSNEFGCVDSAVLDVIFEPRPRIQHSGKLNICKGDSVVFTLDPRLKLAEWFKSPNFGPLAKGSRFVVYDSGSYFAKVVTQNGCNTFTDTILVDVRSDSNVFEIILSDSERNNILFFDSVAVGILKCLDLYLKNKTSNEVTINSLFIVGNSAFSVPPSQLPLVWKGNETKKITICYYPNKLGIETDTVIIFDRCWNQYIVLKAVAIPNTYNAESSCEISVSGKTISFYRKSYSFVSLPYPNPTTNLVNLIIMGELVSTPIIKIYNTLGKEINNFFERQFREGIYNFHQFELQNLENGVYFLRIYFPTNDFQTFPIYVVR